MNGKTLKRKLMSLLLVAAMVFASAGALNLNNAAYAAENEITVYVTVSDQGELGVTADGSAAVNLPVDVVADANGQATVDAALAAFHDEYFPDGYATSESAYGLSVSKLWGVENGGSYLFAINNVKCNSGVGYDLVEDGDTLTAVVMKDLTYWADLVTGFDMSEIAVMVGEEVELTLSYDSVTYDADWNPTHALVPVVGADVFVAGAADDVLTVTDENGKAVVSFDEAGTYVVTASGAVTMEVQDWAQGGAYVEANAPISAPACVVIVEAEEAEDEPVIEDEPAVEDESVVEDEPTVEDEPAVEDEAEAEKAPETGDASQMALYLILLMAAMGAATVVAKKEK